MNSYDNTFYESSKILTDSGFLIANFFEKYLKQKNIVLLKFQYRRIRKQARECSQLQIKLYWINYRKSKLRNRELEEYILGFNSYIEKAMSDYIDNFENSTQEIVQMVSEENAKNVLAELDKTANMMIRNRKRILVNVKKELKSVYKNILKNLKMILELGKEISEEYEVDDKDNKYMALLKILQNSCLTLSEIYCLIENGFPDGAIARWRTLHESAVVGELLVKSDNEVSELFFEHCCVSDYKEMQSYIEHMKQLDLEPIDESGKKRIEDEYDLVTEKYGKVFASDYGWYYKKSYNGKITFTDLEKKANLNYLRPYYKLACNNIHISSKSLLFKIGNLTSENDSPLMH
jgi:hypothetical protein